MLDSEKQLTLPDANYANKLDGTNLPAHSARRFSLVNIKTKPQSQMFSNRHQYRTSHKAFPNIDPDNAQSQ